jgi:hypothetical protein
MRVARQRAGSVVFVLCRPDRECRKRSTDYANSLPSGFEGFTGERDRFELSLIDKGQPIWLIALLKPSRVRVEELGVIRDRFGITAGSTETKTTFGTLLGRTRCQSRKRRLDGFQA